MAFGGSRSQSNIPPPEQIRRAVAKALDSSLSELVSAEDFAALACSNPYASATLSAVRLSPQQERAAVTRLSRCPARYSSLPPHPQLVSNPAAELRDWNNRHCGKACKLGSQSIHDLVDRIHRQSILHQKVKRDVLESKFLGPLLPPQRPIRPTALERSLERLYAKPVESARTVRSKKKERQVASATRPEGKDAASVAAPHWVHHLYHDQPSRSEKARARVERLYLQPLTTCKPIPPGQLTKSVERLYSGKKDP